MNSFKRKLKRYVFSFFTLIFPILVFADHGNTTCDSSGGKICNPIHVNTVNEFIKVFLEGIIRIGFPIIALAIIYSGFLFVFARGKPEALKKAKDSLMYTLIGSAILLGSWAIAQLISSTVLSL